MTLREAVAGLRRARSRAALFRRLREVSAACGLPWLAYAALRDRAAYRPEDCPPPAVMLHFPQDWVARYTAADHARSDPVLGHAASIGVPFLWDWLAALRNLEDDERQVLEAARQHGLAGGLSVPLRGPGGTRALVSCATADPAVRIEAVLGRLGICAAMFHVAYVERVGLVPAPGAAPRLTGKELECLRWVAAGKTSWEIARILTIHETTVRAYLRRAMRKLDASSRAMAVARALRHGLIE